MEIALNNPAPSLEKIISERERLDIEIAAESEKTKAFKRRSTQYSIIAAICAYTMTTMIWSKEWINGAIADIAIATDIHLSIVKLLAFYVGAAVACMIIVTVLATIAQRLEKHRTITKTLRERRDELEDAPKQCCVEIVEWLNDKTISAYSQSVNAQARLLITAEVDAMRSRVESAWLRATEEEIEQRIEAACRAVYAPELAH